MKPILCLTMLTALTITSRAQTKVFREVSNEISTQINIIRQDGALVGYVAFTQLEKANEDSFNYKISIMDENLNDIGSVNFRQERLQLQAVSFDQDVLCLGYVKRGKQGPPLKGRKAAKIKVKSMDNAVMLQFLGLDGKILSTTISKAELNLNEYTGAESLSHTIQVKNVPNAGFAFFYGDQFKNKLSLYNYQGTQVWEKPVSDGAKDYLMLASTQGIYLLSKKKDKYNEGGYEVTSFNNADGAQLNKYIAKDKKQNSLRVLQFDLDPATSKPYISGNIINMSQGNKNSTSVGLAKGLYDGVFTVNFNGPKKSDIKEVFTYWNDGSQAALSARGKMRHNNSFAKYHGSFRDAEGNTYFTGSSVIKRVKWGAFITSAITLPLLYPPMLILSNGTNKYKMMDAVVLVQDSKGQLTVADDIKTNHGKFYTGRAPIYYPVNREINSVYNSYNKTNYLIMYDPKDITIYNVNQKKTLRVIPRKDGSVSTYVFPAKEGHVMVAEYNKKEQTSRYSIEAL